jgi:hypothetical protein
MENREFYVNLGRLLYAVAMADGEVQDEELQAMYRMVIKELSDEQLFNQEHVNVFHTEFEFEALMDRKASKQEAFDSFIAYFDLNHSHFTPEMKSVTLHAVEKIASSFQGVVASERMMIDALKKRINMLD